MKDEDKFDFGQYPDLLGVGVPFGEDFFEQNEEVHLAPWNARSCP